MSNYNSHWDATTALLKTLGDDTTLSREDKAEAMQIRMVRLAALTTDRLQSIINKLDSIIKKEELK